jgi:uncharacterized membrane protein
MSKSSDPFDRAERGFKWAFLVIAILSVASVAFVVWLIFQLLDILRTAAA